MSRTLAEKLGVRDGRAALIGAPSGIVGLPDDEGARPAPMAMAFCRLASEIGPRFEEARAALVPGGVLWLCYPKARGLGTDITRDHGWGPLFDADWLAVAQVAVDATWSAVRFRPRIEIKSLTRKGHC